MTAFFHRFLFVEDFTFSEVGQPLAYSISSFEGNRRLLFSDWPVFILCRKMVIRKIL
jgi:hypothetical protein